MRLSKQGFLLLNYISVASFSSAAITPALPQIATDYQLGHGALEWVVTIFLLGYMFGQLIYGPIANRIGRLATLRTGLCINLVGIAVCVAGFLAHSYGLLLFGRLVTALGASAGLVCTFILINESLSQEQAKLAMSYAIVSFTIGIGAAIFVGGLLVQYLGWQYCFAFLALHGIALLGFSKCLPETLAPAQRRPLSVHSILQQYVNGFKAPRLIGFAVIYSISAVFSYTYTAAAPMIANHYLGLAPSAYGTWNIITMVGMLSGGLLAARLMHKHSAEMTIATGFGLLLIGMALFILLLLSHTQLPLLFFILSAFIYLATSLLFAAAGYFASNAIADRANASGVMNFINIGVAGAAVAVMGYLPFSAFAAFIAVLAGLTMLDLVLWLILRRGKVPVANAV
ncbi:MAG: MFS transporter [Legionellales bacterium]|nr:MFS transporter [Legionellales bacterium]|tara:strand:- start:6100 stop:7296 length:1197 start_codon:yes stop_codon:yes gene_type:complete